MPITHPNLHLTKLAGAIPAWFGEINPATVGWAAPTMSGELCIAIRLGRQNTAAKSLVKPDLHLAPACPVLR